MYVLRVRELINVSDDVLSALDTFKYHYFYE